MSKVDKLLEESITNIRDDRAVTSDLLIDIIKHLKKDPVNHQYVGGIAAKYLETLQRSNEQLVKITSMLQKQDKKSIKLSDDDKNEIYDLINNPDEDDKEA
tara:strand:+ start:1477 stop:1779 length:303 start_codon:yes stop_codon:yes gene_type:complete